MGYKITPVYQALNEPRTLLGIERGPFFLLVTVSVAVFNFSGALLPAILIFIPLFLGLRLFGRSDPQLLRIVMMSGSFATRYDPAKRAPAKVEKGGRVHARSASAA
jgi:type IV secretory pathway VirB3-like protein